MDKKKFLEGAGGANAIGCQRLVLDVEFSYVSTDMDIVLTLRSSDIKSVLPEAKITLGGLSIHGQIRIDIELIPDFPFMGNATVRFVVKIY